MSVPSRFHLRCDYYSRLHPQTFLQKKEKEKSFIVSHIFIPNSFLSPPFYLIHYLILLFSLIKIDLKILIHYIFKNIPRFLL